MTEIVTLGRQGEIALGEQFAGKTVMVEELDPGVWVLKLGEFIPDSERWLHEPAFLAGLNQALEWSADNPPKAVLNELEAQIDGGG